MKKGAPRPAAGPLSSSESDGSVAAVALIVTCAVIALLLLFEVGGGERSAVGGDRPVTVDDLPAATRSSTDLAVTGGIQPRGDTPGRRLGERLVLTPATVEGRAGYAIAPASDALVLAKARLRAGDVLFEIDDLALDPGRIGTLGDELSVLDRVEVTYQRDGLVRSQVIDLTRR